MHTASSMVNTLVHQVIRMACMSAGVGVFGSQSCHYRVKTSSRKASHGGDTSELKKTHYSGGNCDVSGEGFPVVLPGGRINLLFSAVVAEGAGGEENLSRGEHSALCIASSPLAID